MEIIADDELQKESTNSNKNQEDRDKFNINELLIEKEPILLTNLTPIKKIAILLPMTGKYSKIGKSILDGINIQLDSISEYEKPEISIYDTGDEDVNIKNIYSEITGQNFDFVIGPLKKPLINKIISYDKGTIPILTLNYSNKLNKYSKNVYQFGLLPEDEAICIAEKSIIDGNNNASILYPNNNWGERIAQSFSLRFEELGGKIIDKVVYNEENKSINNSIKNLLNMFYSFFPY